MPLPQVVSHTIQAVTASDLVQLVVRRDSTGNIITTSYWNLKDGSGNVVGNGQYSLELSGAALTALVNFINTHHVTGMNAQ